MFQKVLLAWEDAHPPERALAVATELARVYGAKLTIAALRAAPTDGPKRGPAPAQSKRPPEPLDVEIAWTTIAERHPVTGMLALAHEHAFDLIVVGHHAPERIHRVFTHDMARDVATGSLVPVLVVAEGEAVL
jgi:nucleotide-binding universal stress UspA family protein